MDKHRATLIVCMFLCLSFTVSVTNSNRDEEEEQKQNTKAASAASFWLWHKLESFYSLYSKIWSPTNWQWQMLKEAYSRFIPPHLGFSEGGDEALRAEKDAAAKSNGEKKTTSSDEESRHQNEL